jgi:hypothetical protein
LTEKEIRKSLMDHYFQALKYDTIDEHLAGFVNEVETFRGNSNEIVDNGLEAYKKRLESKPPWLKLHEPTHLIDEEDIKISIDPNNPNLASATVWLTDKKPYWFDVFSLRKDEGLWKIFKLRWIPEGGAPV